MPVWIWLANMNNDFWSRMGQFANDFYAWRESLHKWPKSLFTVSHILSYFWSAFVCYKFIHDLFPHCRQGRSFVTYHCDVTTFSLWRHANARNWYKGLRPVLEGFVVTMHEGACETGSQIPRALARGIWRTVRTSPSALWQQTPTDRS